MLLILFSRQATTGQDAFKHLSLTGRNCYHGMPSRRSSNTDNFMVS